jgi:hypothetical protein
MDCECILNLVHVPVLRYRQAALLRYYGRPPQNHLHVQHTSAAGYLPIIALTAKWEQASAESIVAQDLAM